MKPLCVDLFCGLGGWTDGFLDAGYHVIGVDLVAYPDYRGELLLQDVRTLNGKRFYGADVIVASPPCEEFSRHRMPWTRAKAREPDLTLVDAAYRIGIEAEPRIFILENVREAQRWLGPPVCNRGPYYFWGTPPLLSKMEFPPKEAIDGQRPELRARIPYNLARQVADMCALSLKKS